MMRPVINGVLDHLVARRLHDDLSSSQQPPGSLKVLITGLLECSTASAAVLLRASSNASLVSIRFCSIFEPSAGATSSSSCVISMTTQEGMVATMFARYPKIIDFSCGFQSYLPSVPAPERGANVRPRGPSLLVRLCQFHYTSPR